MSELTIQLALASVMVLVTVIVHLVGLAVLVRVLRSHHHLAKRLQISPLTLLLAASIGLFALHTIEIWLYALLYLLLGAIGDFETSLYFSTVTYASVGYGDVLLGKPWRILGAIEGATGIIMLGWSTAFLVSLLAQLKLLSHDWLTPTRDGKPRGETRL
ncbi:potassium channel family protein [Sphingomonas sp.]|uniref:potassium channel family protein n=1 Tax=Sphingomonas sp. TaxID=28214 RepID=UPI00286E42E4|nr:potassium channel family protein [Sphingomonas sp.]